MAYSHNIELDELNDRILASVKSFMETKYKSAQKIVKTLKRINRSESQVKLIKEIRYNTGIYQRLINKAMGSDLRKYNVQLAQNTIEPNSNMKVGRSKR